jgi:hypothetical protein
MRLPFFDYTLWVQALIPPYSVFGDNANQNIPFPPRLEPINVVELSLPPVVSSNNPGACTLDINPRRTGCIAKETGLFGGNFLPDGKHVVAAVTFSGAPAAPDPASIFTGDQLILVKADGTTFPNGDPWKCVTCGVPTKNSLGRTDDMRGYPQAFHDGSRVLVGTNIISCGKFQLASEDCLPEQTFIYSIRWQNSNNNSGPGGSIRELRIHPDGVHLGFNSFGVVGGKLSQSCYLARLDFNPLPAEGEPLAPRYDLINSNLLVDPTRAQPLTAQDGELQFHTDAITVGELRGFSGTGKEVTYIGYPRESCNIDVFAADLTTGKIRRLTSHPEYVDPVDISADDEWTVVMDTRTTGRQMFMAGMPGVPPITDIITTTVCSSTRNNGQRRFFRPFLIDRYGDRGDYFGQRINAAGSGIAGSGDINDPEWNGSADPKFSLDGTKIAYWQVQTVSPSCGGANPLPCYNSTAQGGRHQRLMVARLTSRKPLPVKPVAPIPDRVPWAVQYTPGMQAPTLGWPGDGKYTLKAKVSGSASVTLVGMTGKPGPRTVAVIYHNFSDDGLNFLTGWENVTIMNPNITNNLADWYSDLKRTGTSLSTKKTGPGGFHLQIDTMTNIFDANGTLTTTIDGVEYKQPINGG